MLHPLTSSNYRYQAPEDGWLTGAQQASFAEWGILVLEDYFTSHQADQLKHRIQHILSHVHRQLLEVSSGCPSFSPTELLHVFLAPKSDLWISFEKDAFMSQGDLAFPFYQAVNKVSHALHDLDPVFKAFSYQEKIKATLHTLGYVSPILAQSMYIFKQPKMGSSVQGHQDASFLHSLPMPVIGLWFALEDAMVNNGCLWALPGRHFEPLRNKYIRYPDGRADFEFYNTQPWLEDEGEAVEVPQGSLVILHGYLPHGSYPNQSDVSRHAFSLHCMDASSTYPATNWLQRGVDQPFHLWT